MKEHMDDYEEIAIFFNEPVAQVKVKCAEAHNRLNLLWRRANPVSEEERIKWYRETDAHIYEGANWHNSHLEVRWEIARKAGGKILCFGSGIGTEGIMAAETGKEVSFYDLDSLTYKFLKFRVHLRQLAKVTFIDKEMEKKASGKKIFFEDDAFEMYDTIICIDVLEHLIYPQEVLNFLGAHLKPDGLFLVSAPFHELDYLGHLPENKYLDIDLMMKIARIGNYRKEILARGDEIGMATSSGKLSLVRLVDKLPLRVSLKHKILYLATFIMTRIDRILNKRTGR
jgi:2-polyprenyl-3-methyl-5-hydroxy-6-metoxy-1,4-benzoquinol methylase